MCIKDRRISLVFRFICVVVCGYGLFTNFYKQGVWNFAQLNYYTIQSNLLCWIYFIINFVETLKEYNDHGKEGTTTFLPRFKGAVVLAILVTFLIFHVLLRPSIFSMDGGGTYFWSASNLIAHYIVPMMMLFDYILFDEKGIYKAIDPFMWTLIPFAYFGFAIVRAQIGAPFHSGSRYPYFFIDFDQYGMLTILRNVVLIFIFFVIFGYIIYFIDQALGKSKRPNRYS